MKGHEINNVTHQTDNTIMIYNKTTKEVYVDKQQRVKAKGFNNHNTNKSDIHWAKSEQKIKRKDEEELKVRQTENMKRIEEKKWILH